MKLEEPTKLGIFKCIAAQVVDMSEQRCEKSTYKAFLHYKTRHIALFSFIRRLLFCKK